MAEWTEEVVDNKEEPTLLSSDGLVDFAEKVKNYTESRTTNRITAAATNSDGGLDITIEST